MSEAHKPPILAVCVTAIGDLMFCTPALAALSASFAVDVLVHEKRAALLAHNPHVRAVYKYRNNGFRRAWLGLRLRRTAYEKVAVLHANDDFYKLLRFLRYQQAWGIQGWDIPRLRLKSLPRHPGSHIIDLRLMVAEACGASIPPLPARRPELYLTPQERETARQWLAGRGGQVPLAGLVIGGAHDALRRWPINNFVRLAHDLRSLGVQPVIIGSASEKPLLPAFREAGLNNLILAFDLNLRLLAGIISRLSVLVTNDTGPLHLAHALQVPMVSLFGVTNPALLAPRDQLNRIISVYSMFNQENKEHLMDLIPYQEVLAATRKALLREPAQ